MQSSAQRTALLALALALMLGSLAACFDPIYQEGLACSESGSCPTGQLCQNSVCSLPSAERDAGPRADAASQGDADSVCEPGSQTFAYTGVLDTFTVPDCVTSLTIEAFGAQGGGGRAGVGGGGLGARVKGDFAVAGGDSLQILVGGQGIEAAPNANLVGTTALNLQQGGGTGGGGSYVVNALSEVLIVAGGGGGATHTAEVNSNGTIVTEILLAGGPGQISEEGQAGGGGGTAGGSAGSGGITYPNPGGFHSGTGGGGFLGDGIGSSDGSVNDFGSPNSPGKAFANGGGGGVGGSVGRSGAFGGGGAAGYTGGGGGGYSGGGTGTVDGVYGAGGGGSLNAGTSPDNSAGVREGPGQITISW